MASADEKKVDPATGEAVTFAEMKKSYGKQYKKAELQAYWDDECKPVKKGKAKAKAKADAKAKAEPKAKAKAEPKAKAKAEPKAKAEKPKPAPADPEAAGRTGKDGGASALAKLKSYSKCVLAEYVWLDIGQVPRSKTMTMTCRPNSVKDLRIWNYDGSSTGQAEGENSEINLKPVAIFNDPFRGFPHVIVLAEAYNAWDDKPSNGNTRAACLEMMEKYKDMDPWFGIEQEYTLMVPQKVGLSSKQPLGFNKDGSEPAPQGPYYCGAGYENAIGRPVADDHYKKCLEAGIKITGINAEVMPGQWEYQIGPCRGIEMGDHLVMARYIMMRVTESHNCQVSFHPKPQEGDWNGAGCHTNFSIAQMRAAGGYEVILKVCEAFGKVTKEHIDAYGTDNEKRLTGKHETCSINQFKYGVANRGASIRIPRSAEKDGRGYMEDRRPAANCDPYKVTAIVVKTTGECLAGTMDYLWPIYERKMKKDGMNKAAIEAFKYNLGVLLSGAETMIPETSLNPVDSLTTYESLPSETKPELLKQTVILKLNGGLGTGMGLDKAKSLLTVTEKKSFLDLIALQVKNMKETFKQKDLKFMLMNSFSTSADTKKALAKYKDLGKGPELEFVQNKAPKVTASDMTPASWKADRGHEWCPPGHGDLYPAMLGSGTLDKLLKKGFKYMFVSNSDNLGATMDLKILTHFAESKAPFMMEVAERTDADKKGGHLAKDKASGGLLLRESAQCPDADEKEFQNVAKYKFFNTNNLWVDLEALKAQFEKHNGCLPLPVMKNSKTVDPRDKESTKVLQLETAMGAAISCFEGASALVIPRSRFAPVKTTNDLFALRSDAYTLTPESTIVLAEARKGVPPNIKLDGAYKFVDAMEKLIPKGPPSLIDCTGLTVEGKVVFEAGVVIKGKVTIKGGSDEAKTVKTGTYEDTTVEL